MSYNMCLWKLNLNHLYLNLKLEYLHLKLHNFELIYSLAELQQNKIEFNIMIFYYLLAAML